MSGAAQPRLKVRAGVIGFPIAHSRSPLIHTHWLKAYNIAGSYERIEVAPDALAGFVQTLEANGYAGCNVTVPHKERAFALVDECDDAARRLGAVNTIWCDAGRIFGSNTDLYGFLANLDATLPDWSQRPGKAIVLGAGGAARAVIAALAARGFAPLVIVNRNQQRARQLALELRIEVQVIGWEDAAAALRDAALLVNTSTLGMTGHPPLELDLHHLPGSAVVSDIVYAPLRTGLLRAAQARGNRICGGLGMLLHQAVPGFERWFGVRPDVTDDLHRLIERDLGER